MLTKDEIKERVAIDVIVNDDIGEPVKESGDWQLYFCPFHANTRTPALGVNVETDTFKCFSCQEQGDIFTWRMLREGEDFKQALTWFRTQLGENKKRKRLNTAAKRKPTANDQPPSLQWQARGREFAQYAQDQLWNGAAGLQYGLDELFRRGLKVETIITWGIGYNPEWASDDPVRWGTIPRKTDQKVWLARGLVIPCEVDETLWYLKIRVFDDDGKPVGDDTEYGKYNQPAGGKGTLFGAGRFQCKPGLLLAESELDALLAWQEGYDFLDVATLGGAGKRLNSQWLPYLLPYQRIFLAYDQDQAGQNGSQKLATLSQRLVISMPPDGDLIDFHRNGGNVREMMKRLHENIGCPVRDKKKLA